MQLAGCLALTLMLMIVTLACIHARGNDSTMIKPERRSFREDFHTHVSVDIIVDDQLQPSKIEPFRTVNMLNGTTASLYVPNPTSTDIKLRIKIKASISSRKFFVHALSIT